jgi:hypothetical protein
MLDLILLLALASAPGDPPDDPKPTEAKPIESVADQKKAAEEVWKAVLSGRPFQQKETDHFLLYGSVDQKELDALARAVEKAFPTIKQRATVGPKDELWERKLVIHVFGQRAEYAAFVRNTQKRSPDKDETGSYTHTREQSFVTASPAADGKKGLLEAEVIQQLAAATLSKKYTKLPEWLVTGFGRSVAYKHAPELFREERRKAAQLAAAGKSPKDVWTGNASSDEGPVLAASFLEYLQTPKVAKFFPELLGLVSDDTSFEESLKSAKMPPDQVEAAWRQWARSAR